MRLLSFNVNSLQRLLHHPLAHILKKSPEDAAAAAAAAAAPSAPTAAATSTPHSIAQAALAAESVLATATAVAAGSAPSSSNPELRTQEQIDAYEAAKAAAARERAALVQQMAAGTPSMQASSAQLQGLLDGLQADIICFQEVKMARAKLPASMALVDGYDAFFAFSRKKLGYSGVVTFCKKPVSRPFGSLDSSTTIAALTKGAATPIRAEEGFTGTLSPELRDKHASVAGRSHGTNGNLFGMTWDLDDVTLRELDSEGRCVMTDHGEFVLFNVYIPALSEREERNHFKLTFCRALQLRCENLIRSGRHVVIVGDLNACAEQIDHADFSAGWKRKRPKQIQKLVLESSVSLADGEAEERDLFYAENTAREWLRKMLVSGGGMFVDVFRSYFPDRQNAYTYWSTKQSARYSNYGMRLDYVLADSALVDKGFFTACDIRPDIHCSDHCPVQVDFNVLTLCNDPHRPPPPLCSKFMPEFSGAQQKLQALFAKQMVTTAQQSLPRPCENDSSSVASCAAMKRPLSFNDAAGSGPSKKARTSRSKLTAAAAGSMSMRTFFGAKTTPSNDLQTEPTCDALPIPAHTSQTQHNPSNLSAHLHVNPSTSLLPPKNSALPLDKSSSASAWAALLDQKSVAVRCRCGHFAKQLSVTKQGPNQGRKFYICPVPPPRRCEYFLWATQVQNSKI